MSIGFEHRIKGISDLWDATCGCLRLESPYSVYLVHHRQHHIQSEGDLPTCLARIFLLHLRHYVGIVIDVALHSRLLPFAPNQELLSVSLRNLSAGIVPVNIILPTYLLGVITRKVHQKAICVRINRIE